jgi:hypothetical protein
MTNKLDTQTGMKTITDLFTMVSNAIERSSETTQEWFFRFSGHVDVFEIEYFDFGWGSKKQSTAKLSFAGMTEDNIQAAFWFIKANLR